MQGTGRRSAPSLFCHFASHRTVRRALFRTACQTLLRTAWRPPAPAHRHRRTAACAAPVSSASLLLTARRPHLRPPPVTSLPHSRPRRPPCLPLPGGFFPTFRCVFRTRHATNVCTFVQHAENKYVTIKAEKDNFLTESKLHFSGFPPSGTALPIRNLHDAFFCLYWRKIITNTLLT